MLVVTLGTRALLPGVTGYREKSCLSVPVVAAREGWSLWGGQCSCAAGSPAKRRRVVSLCRWSLLERDGRCGKARALLLRVLRPVGDGLSLRAGGCSYGGVVAEGAAEPSYCRFSGQGVTGCVSVSVVAAGQGWLLTRG